MMNARTRHAHLMLVICLALSFLAGTADSVRADADPKDIQTVNRIFSSFVSVKLAPPLQIAIWEADVVDCLNNFQLMRGEDAAATHVSICADRKLPANIALLYYVALSGASGQFVPHRRNVVRPARLGKTRRWTYKELTGCTT